MKIEEISKGIFRVKVPLPNNPLKWLNSYILIDDDRPLVIDIGLNRNECYETLTEALSNLGFTWQDVNLLFSHGHPDHCGAIDRVYNKKMSIYAGFKSFYQLEKKLADGYSQFCAWLASCSKVSSGQDNVNTSQRPQSKFNDRFTAMSDIEIPQIDIPIHRLSDGDTISIGQSFYNVIHVTGHSSDHLCLFEKNQGVLISGDQVLPNISPAIVTFSLNENPLKEYLTSLRRLKNLSASCVLPGHREPFFDLQGRIIQLETHHKERADELLNVLWSGDANVADVARKLTWKNPIANWNDWPMKQKYFSLGETLAHLSYLISLHKVRFYRHGSEIRFSICM